MHKINDNRPFIFSKPILVELEKKSYPIYVERGLVRYVGRLLKEKFPSAQRYVIVTSDEIQRMHGEALITSFNEEFKVVGLAIVPDGEEAKTWNCAGELIGELLDQGLDRHSIVVAFGGGTVGDLAGFAASIFLRGIRLVQIPTTLLAQVDSSIGGKAAVNHPKGKNLIGSFHHPSLVVSDPNLLASLPKRELLSGLGEVVKHGVIADEDLFKFAEVESEKLVNADPEALTFVIRRSALIKAKLVRLDERDEKGIRAVLNYGHTFGHALETITAHHLKHGEAVAVGMGVAARISVMLGLMDKEDLLRQNRLLNKLGFELEPQHLDILKLVELMRRDKKVEMGSIRFVLPTGIGNPPILKVIPEHLICQVLEGMGFG